MSEERKNDWSKLLKYGLSAVFGLGIAILIMSYKDLWNQTEWVDRLLILSDAFTVPAILFICMGILTWVANNDGFMGLTYLLSFALRAVVPGIAAKKEERYGEYRARMEKREKKKGYAFLFVVGGIFGVLTAVCMILFYRLY